MGIACYQARDGSVPAEALLDSCPLKVEATMLAVLEAVRQAPPPQFGGGGKWEAMHGTMGGYCEIRVTGPARARYRLFCRLENGTATELAERGFQKPQIAVIAGMCEPFAPCQRHESMRPDPQRRHGPRHLAPNNNDREEQAALAA